jgi:hypothetical protein
MNEDEGSGRHILSVRLRRIGAPATEGAQIPSVHDLKLHGVEREAIRWQIIRSDAPLMEASAGHLGRRARDRFHEVCGLFGSSAESVLLAIAAEAEVHMLEASIAAGQLPAAYGMAERFLAEAVCNTIVAVTTRMLSMAFRIAMVDSGYPWGVNGGRKALRSAVPPYSDIRDHWATLRDLDQFGDIVSASRSQPLHRLYGAIKRFTDGDIWREVESQRGEDHHRWRFESPYVGGLNRRTMWEYKPGVAIISGGTPEYTDAAAIVEEVQAIAFSGLQRLARAMREFRLAYFASVSAVSNGAIMLRMGTGRDTAHSVRVRRR